MYRTRESERAHHTWLVLALDRHKGSYSDRKRALKWVLLVTVPRAVLDDATNLAMGPGNDAARLRTASVSQDPRKCLRTASVRQDQRKYCVLVTLPNHLFCNASLL